MTIKTSVQLNTRPGVAGKLFACFNVVNCRWLISQTLCQICWQGLMITHIDFFSLLLRSSLSSTTISPVSIWCLNRCAFLFVANSNWFSNLCRFSASNFCKFHGIVVVTVSIESDECNIF